MIPLSPLRREIVAEMHLRPSPVVIPPARIYQILVLDEARAGIANLATKLGVATGTERELRHGSRVKNGIQFFWERHTEAFTFTMVLRSDMSERAVEAAVDVVSDSATSILRAVRVDVVTDRGEAGRLCGELSLDGPDTVSGIVADLQFWSNFTLNEHDGLGRVVVLVGDAGERDTGRTVQQLQELGNYRNLALLALPVVRELAPKLGALEAEVGDVIERLLTGGEDHHLLEDLVSAAARVARLRSASAYRLSATRAYGLIVADRLQSLDPVRVDGFQTLGEFTNRRLLPALRTCENFGERLELLAVRIEHASSLLRARIDTQLQRQNGELLHSLSRTAQHQLHLQHLVEGLSVFAVAYYGLGILSYALDAAPRAWIGEPHQTVGLLALPLVVFLAIYLRFKRRAQPNF